MFKSLHVQCDPLTTQAGRKPQGCADQSLRMRGRSNPDKQPVANRKNFCDGIPAFEFLHFRVDALGGMPQSQFAQGNQVSRLEEILRGTNRLVPDIYFSFRQAFHQIRGRQIHEFHFLRFFQENIRYRFPTLIPVIWATTSFRLSQCWTFKVV